MPTVVSRALLALTLAAFAAAIAPAGAGAADDRVAELRVVAPGAELEPGSELRHQHREDQDRPEGEVLHRRRGRKRRQRRSCRARPRWGCWRRRGDVNRDVNPLSVTDEFGFGLGLCGIGDAKATTRGLLVAHGRPPGRAGRRRPVRADRRRHGALEPHRVPAAEQRSSSCARRPARRRGPAT